MLEWCIYIEVESKEFSLSLFTSCAWGSMYFTKLTAKIHMNTDELELVQSTYNKNFEDSEAQTHTKSLRHNLWKQDTTHPFHMQIINTSNIWSHTSHMLFTLSKKYISDWDWSLKSYDLFTTAISPSDFFQDQRYQESISPAL